MTVVAVRAEGQPVVEVDLEQVALRIIQEAILSALADHWDGRARTFTAARPQPDDFTGSATPAGIAAADQRCRETALACSNHATAIRRGWIEAVR